MKARTAGRAMDDHARRGREHDDSLAFALASIKKPVSLLLNAALAGEDYFEACAVAIRVGEAVKTSENDHTS
jgi:hypothetical protein